MQLGSESVKVARESNLKAGASKGGTRKQLGSKSVEKGTRKQLGSGNVAGARESNLEAERRGCGRAKANWKQER